MEERLTSSKSIRMIVFRGKHIPVQILLQGYKMIREYDLKDPFLGRSFKILTLKKN
jgi:hypothetical protein